MCRQTKQYLCGHVKGRPAECQRVKKGGWSAFFAPPSQQQQQQACNHYIRETLKVSYLCYACHSQAAEEPPRRERVRRNNYNNYIPSRASVDRIAEEALALAEVKAAEREAEAARLREEEEARAAREQARVREQARAREQARFREQARAREDDLAEQQQQQQQQLAAERAQRAQGVSRRNAVRRPREEANRQQPVRPYRPDDEVSAFEVPTGPLIEPPQPHHQSRAAGANRGLEPGQGRIITDFQNLRRPGDRTRPEEPVRRRQPRQEPQRFRSAHEVGQQAARQPQPIRQSPRGADEPPAGRIRRNYEDEDARDHAQGSSRRRRERSNAPVQLQPAPRQHRIRHANPGDEPPQYRPRQMFDWQGTEHYAQQPPVQQSARYVSSGHGNGPDTGRHANLPEPSPRAGDHGHLSTADWHVKAMRDAEKAKREDEEMQRHKAAAEAAAQRNLNGTNMRFTCALPDRRDYAELACQKGYTHNRKDRDFVVAEEKDEDARASLGQLSKRVMTRFGRLRPSKPAESEASFACADAREVERKYSKH